MRIEGLAPLQDYATVPFPTNATIRIKTCNGYWDLYRRSGSDVVLHPVDGYSSAALTPSDCYEITELLDEVADCISQCSQHLTLYLD